MLRRHADLFKLLPYVSPAAVPLRSQVHVPLHALRLPEGRVTVYLTDTVQAPSGCPVCDGFRVLPRLHHFGLVCTCGAGPVDEMTLHDVACDTVPCPFCQLADTPLKSRVLR